MNARHLDEILELYDKPFLEAAYRALLGRSLDQPGETAHLSALRQGQDKKALLYTIAESAEAKAYHPAVDGLDQFLQQMRREKVPIFGRLVRFNRRFSDRMQQRNRLENIMGRLFHLLSTPGAVLSATATSVAAVGAEDRHGMTARELEILDALEEAIARRQQSEGSS